MRLRLRQPVVLLVFVCLVLFHARGFAQKASSKAAASPSTPAQNATPAQAGTPAEPMAPKEVQTRFTPLDDVLKNAVKDGDAPGGVLIVAHNGMFVYRKAFGHRTTGANPEPMTEDTIFDLASLTKVIATTTCVMRMEQLGQIKLNDPVAKYIPDFAQNGKEDVTIRMLLTHYSGLPADIDLKQPWNGAEEGYSRANASKLENPPGSTFLYSDVGFVVLGELVQKVTGMPLDQYAQTYVFGPLGMTWTRFNPPQTMDGAHCSDAAG